MSNQIAKSKPVLKLLDPQNWATLFTGTSGAHLTLNSPTTYTVKNAQGVEIEMTGTKLKATNFFGLHILSGGTITGFDILKKGKRIAVGSGYDLPGSSFYNAVFRYLLGGAKTALFDLFLNAGKSISGSWKSVESGLSSFRLHKSITRINVTSGVAKVSTATFAQDKAALDKIVGGFQVYGTAAQVTAKLDALEKDASHIKSVLIDSGKAKVSTSSFAAEKIVLNKIVGGFEVFGAATSVKAKLGSLLGNSKKISSVAVTKGKIAVAGSTFAKDKTILDKVIGGFSIQNSAADLKGKLAALEADAKHINSVKLTKGVLAVSIPTLGHDKAILNKFAGGFQVDATLKAIEGDVKALEWEAAHDHLESVHIVAKGTPIIHLTAVEAKSGHALLKAIHGDHIVDVRKSTGVTTNAYGNGLHVHDIKGHDAIFAGGAKEHFIFAADFGQASITGLHNHLTGKTHDTIDVQKSEFASFAALLHDAHQSGHAVVIDGKHGDKLTLENVTMAELRHAKSDFAFV